MQLHAPAQPPYPRTPLVTGLPRPRLPVIPHGNAHRAIGSMVPRDDDAADAGAPGTPPMANRVGHGLPCDREREVGLRGVIRTPSCLGEGAGDA